MSKGPWRIKGRFSDPRYSILLRVFSPQEKTYSTFAEAELSLSHLVAYGQKLEFEGNLELVNEKDDVICRFERNPHNYGAKILLVETNTDLKDIKKFYRHGYRLEENIRFYYHMSSEGMSKEQLYVFSYLVTALHNAAMYMSGPDLINLIHPGNTESLYDMVMAGNDISSTALGNALQGIAVINNKPFV